MKKNILKILWFILILVSCNKHDITDSQSEIIGDYEWFYSLDSFYNTTAQDNTSDKWGIRIKSNSKIFVFKNEEEIFKGKITSIVPESVNGTGGWDISVQHKDFTTVLRFKDNQLKSWHWPFDGNTNNYLKQ